MNAPTASSNRPAAVSATPGFAAPGLSSTDRSSRGITSAGRPSRSDARPRRRSARLCAPAPTILPGTSLRRGNPGNGGVPEFRIGVGGFREKGPEINGGFRARKEIGGACRLSGSAEARRTGSERNSAAMSVPRLRHRSSCLSLSVPSRQRFALTSGCVIAKPNRRALADPPRPPGAQVPWRQLAQFAEPGLVAPPPFDRCAVDRLTRLPDARRGRSSGC